MQVSPKDCQQAVDIVLPFLLEQGLTGESKEVQGICVHYLREVAKVCYRHSTAAGSRAPIAGPLLLPCAWPCANHCTTLL